MSEEEAVPGGDHSEAAEAHTEQKSESHDNFRSKKNEQHDRTWIVG
jgi:hypothetical protein